MEGSWNDVWGRKQGLRDRRIALTSKQKTRLFATIEDMKLKSIAKRRLSIRFGRDLDLYCVDGVEHLADGTERQKERLSFGHPF